MGLVRCFVLLGVSGYRSVGAHHSRLESRRPRRPLGRPPAQLPFGYAQHQRPSHPQLELRRSLGQVGDPLTLDRLDACPARSAVFWRRQDTNGEQG